MKLYTYSVLILFLQWTTFTEKCLGQKTLLTLIGDTCIANTSSAMAMIYKLSDSKLKHMSNFRLEASESKSLTQRQGLKICNTPGCFQWHYINSLESKDVNNLITDWRWENFITIMTKFTTMPGESLDYQEAAKIVQTLEKVTIPFSVQVEKEAHVFICDGDEVPASNCIWFMLEAWGGRTTAVRICKANEIQRTYDGSAPNGNCSIHEIQRVHGYNFPHFLNESLWNHFKIVKTGNRYSLEKQNGGEIINVTDFSNIQPKKVFFHTKAGLGLWKVHNFDYIYTVTTYSALESNGILKPSGGSSCLAMFVVMCPSCSMEITLKSSGFDLHHSTERTQDEQWKEIKLVFNAHYSQDLKITPRSTEQWNNFWAISHLRECYSDELRIIKSAHPNIWTKKCQLLEDESILDKQNPVSVLDNWEKCQEDQFGEDCIPCKLVFDGGKCPQKSKYCQLIKGISDTSKKCYCSTGSTGQNCEESCSSQSAYSYGHGCKQTCPNCQDTCSNDPVHGKCNVNEKHGFRLCSDNYLGDKCDYIGIYNLKDLPEVEVGYTSVNLSVKSLETKSGGEPKFYKIQYKEEKDNKENYKDVPNQPLNWEFTEKIPLENLHIETSYVVRVFGFDKNEDLVQLSQVSVPEQQFMTKCNDIKEEQIIVKTNETYAEFWIKDDKSSKYMCKNTTYSFLFKSIPIPNTIDKYILTNLEPGTEYNIDVMKQRLVLKKTFKTKEAVPQKVENFNYTRTENPTELILKWSKPLKTNGIILFYQITFKVTKYLACLERALDEEKIERSIPANITSTFQAALKPFANYSIEIKANTSAGFGPSESINVLTNSTESLSSEEIPELVETFPGVNNCTMNFSMAPCENMTGFIFAHFTLKGSDPWCNRRIVSQELSSPLVLKNLDPFCNYTAVIELYRTRGKNEITYTTEFRTLETVPNRIDELKVYSKGRDYISLRWSPPHPPTGQLEKYIISYNSTGGSNQKISDPEPCRLWSHMHCETIKELKNNENYTVQVQSKNKDVINNSEAAVREVKTSIKKRSSPPHDLKMSWTEENYLQVFWSHPGFVCGVIKKFRIYVNQHKEDLDIGSEEKYNSNYNITIKDGLIFPDTYNVSISTWNLAGESENITIEGKGPPPIPEEYVKKIEHKGQNISINFGKMKKYNKNFTRYLYVLITECRTCQEDLSVVSKEVCSAQKYGKLSSSKAVHNWTKVKTYENRKINKNYRDHLNIGLNSTNTIVKPNVKYYVAFIWVHQLDNYTRMNCTIVPVGPEIPVASESRLSLKVMVPSMLLVVAVLFLILLYISMGRQANTKIRQLFRREKTSTDEHEYVNNVSNELPLLSGSNQTVRSSIRIKYNKKPEIICPGNPMFKTDNSKRVKLENFQDYVKDAISSNELLNQHSLFPQGLTKPCTTGALPENKTKNRYNNLCAYDHSRVILRTNVGVEHSDYINANYIDGYHYPRAYIATQGPKKNTIQDFWRMVWQEKVTHIVVMANVYEGGKRKMEQYWPDNDNEVIFGDFTITFLSTEVGANYEYRKFKLQYQSQDPRQIGQLHFKVWPDHGVPLYPQSLVPILQKMLTFRSENFPIVVHCSAGVGRTGTVILCDICLRMAAAEGFVDVLAMLEHLRNQRPNMVDNVEQYKLAHLVILNCLTGLRTSIRIDQDFPKTVDDLLESDRISSQLQYIRSCEWEDDAMKTVSFVDEEEMPTYPEKDRFPHIVPDKASRVFLCPYPASDPSPSSVYINAIRVDAYCDPGRFLVTPFPLPDAVGDFWRLVTQKGISVIVCLNDIPVKDDTCDIFFPIRQAELSPVETIKIKHIKDLRIHVYTILTFQVTVTDPRKETKVSTVEIIKFRGWKALQQLPDYGNFINFVVEAIKVSRKSVPTLVTCYDGATASGLFLAMSFLMEKIKLEQELDVCQAVRSIRNSRKEFTNTEEQLKFLYKASVLFVEQQFSQYSNMDIRGSFGK